MKRYTNRHFTFTIRSMVQPLDVVTSHLVVILVLLCHTGLGVLSRVRAIPVSGIAYRPILASTGEYRYRPILILALAPIPVVLSFIYLPQHCCMHAYSFKRRVGLILRNRSLQHCWQQQVGRASARLKDAAAAGSSLHSDTN